MTKACQHFISLSKKYLTELDKIEGSFIKKDIKNISLINFWKGLVRDSEGKWLKYYFEGYKYFQYGIQSEPDLTNKSNLSLIKAAIRQNKAFVKGLITPGYKDYKTWLMLLHKKQIYNQNKVSFISRRRFALVIHSKIVLNAIIPLAIKFNDPYINKGTQILKLHKISKKGLPKDVWQNETEVFHYYPYPTYLDEYFKVMEEKLEDIISNTQLSEKEYLSKVALYYQYGINTHMFENINQSLFANQMNALLQIHGFKPINHGILDFVAMRLQPKNFSEYFIREVQETKAGRASSSFFDEKEKKYLKISKFG